MRCKSQDKNACAAGYEGRGSVELSGREREFGSEGRAEGRLRVKNEGDDGRDVHECFEEESCLNYGRHSRDIVI